MTETITIRLRRSKSEVQTRARPNLNAWVNDLIEQALGPRKADWDEHFRRRKLRKPARYCSDDVRRAGR